MAGLKPFRQIPKDIRDWTRWMRDQDVTNETTINTTVTNSVAAAVVSTKWEIKDFSGNYTTQAEDVGKLLRSTGASATNVTIDVDSILTGEQFTVMQYGAGVVTFVAGTGVTIRSPASLVFNDQYGTITVIGIDGGEVLLAGRMT